MFASHGCIVSGFIAKFPTFAIVDKTMLRESGMVLSIARLTCDEVGQFLPLFTDTDLADRAIAGMGLDADTFLVAAIESLALLKYVLEVHIRTGCKHVIFDTDTGIGARGRSFDAAELLATMERFA